MNNVFEEIYYESFQNQLTKIAQDNNVDPTQFITALEKIAKENEPSALKAGLGLYGRNLLYSSLLGGLGGAVTGILLKKPLLAQIGSMAGGVAGGGLAGQRFIKSRSGKDVSYSTGLKENLKTQLRATGYGLGGGAVGGATGAGIGALIKGKAGARVGGLMGAGITGGLSALYGFGQGAKKIEQKYSK
jgi:hypothetical protein